MLLKIANDGYLIDAEIFQSSGNKKFDREALKAVRETEYAALPDGFRGEYLTFQIEMTKQEFR